MEAVSGSRRRGKALVATVVAGMALALSAGSASAERTYYWNCGLVAPNTWCAAPEIHTYGLVTNWYPTTTQWWCAKLTSPTDPNYYYARQCTYGSRVVIWSDGGGRAPYPNNSVSMKAWVANGNNSNSVWLTGAANF